MPLKLQAHVDSRIWSLQSTVSFFFLSSIWYSEVLFAFKLALQRVYFFQNVRKMHFFPMFRNGVKWHKCHIPSNAFYDSLPCGPLRAHIRFAQNSFFVLRTKSSASSTNQKKPITKQQKNKTTTPFPQKKQNKTKQKNNNNKQTKKQQKNSNKQITKTDKTQQTNVALATARAYKIYVTNVSVFLLFLFIVSSIWGKVVLKPCLGCRGFALIRLFFGGGFARSALFYGICVQWLFS